MAWWVVPIALLVGVVLGTLGGGGGILTVPILTTLLDQTPAQATAGSLVIVGLSSIIGLIPYLRAKLVRVADGVTFGLLGIVGAFAGSKLSVAVPGEVLMSIFAVLLLVVAGLMWRKRNKKDQGEAIERGWPVKIAAATLVGFLTGFFGVGGGFAMVPALTLVLGLNMTSAAATSLLVMTINSASSLTVRAASGLTLDWPLILTFAFFAVVGTLVGTQVSQRLDQRKLQTAFVVLLVLVAIGVAVQNVPLLFA